MIASAAMRTKHRRVARQPTWLGQTRGRAAWRGRGRPRPPFGMYNFFVTAKDGAWDGPAYEFDRSRFLEYTSDELAARFKDLKSRQIQALLKLPCLFAYEGREPMRLGRLTDIRPRGRAVLIEFELDAAGPIAFADIDPHRRALDIRDWELGRTHWAVKNEDLLGRLAGAGLLPRARIAAAADELPEPEPAEARADSVEAFVREVLRPDAGGGWESFYRGHSSAARYRLVPAVMRRDEQGNYLHLDEEHRLYREMLVANPGDFQADTHTLDRLVRMQHYSLPTRLLDITSNPLIALYFACREGGERREGGAVLPEEPGEVIALGVQRDRIKYFDSDTAACLANLAKLPRAERDELDFQLPEGEFNEQKSAQRLLHFVMEEKPFFEPRLRPSDLRSVICVKGKRSNDRIAFQAGAFLLFGHDAVLDEGGTPEIRVRRIAVSGKARLLRELDLLGINERTVFPYIESSARYIAAKFAFKP
jgi:hypothetical protein